MVGDRDTVTLQDLRDEHDDVGIGPLLYGEVNAAVRRSVVRGRYPVRYSPTRQWDEEAYWELAHAWLSKRLLREPHLKDLLMTKQTVEAVRTGLDHYFRHFLIDQRERTALDNLFDRADALLRADPRFRAFGRARKRAEQHWGLACWPVAEPYQGPEAEVVAAGWAVPNMTVVRYNANARKEAHLVPRQDLGRLLEGTLATVARTLTLAQFAIMFRHRFDLDDIVTTPLDAPLRGREHDTGDLRVVDTVAAPEIAEDIVLRRELAAPDAQITAAVDRIEQGLNGRQRRVVVANDQAGATVRSIAMQLQVSKSTVGNDLQHLEDLLRQEWARLEGLLYQEGMRWERVTEDELASIYRRLLERVAPGVHTARDAGGTGERQGHAQARRSPVRSDRR